MISFPAGRITCCILVPLQLKELNHENVNPFVGACVDPPDPCILTNYCSRGSLQVIFDLALMTLTLENTFVIWRLPFSLQDILENDDIKLDRTFKISLMMDLTNVSVC